MQLKAELVTKGEKKNLLFSGPVILGIAFK